MANISFYLSRIMGNKVYSDDRKTIGKLMDVEAYTDAKTPKILALKVKTPEGVKYFDAKYLSIHKEKGQYVLNCSKLVEYPVKKDTLSLVKYVLDKQIIDINGKKVVRVNDIMMAMINDECVILAVDIGMDGLLRRIGIAKPIKMLLSPFKVSVSSKLILWHDIATVFPTSDSLVLSKSHEKLSTLHPSDLADIIEDLDTKTAAVLFSKFDNAKAADVLEEMETENQVSILKILNTDKAADILEEMPPDEVADILDDLSKDEAEELLKSMETEASTEVRELMEYPDNTVGSLMSTDFIALKDNYTSQQAIDYLRELKPEEDTIYYLYIIDSMERLSGVVSLRNLVIADENTPLYDIMQKDFIYVYDTDSINDLIKVVSKYNLMAIPVVDNNMVLAGMVILNDVIYELLKGRRR